MLSPANHKLVDVTVSIEAYDPDDPMPQCRVVMVTANEEVDAPGSGDTEYDWMITSAYSVQLRAERSGGGNDRVYSVHVTCADRSGNETHGSVNVTVPKSSTTDRPAAPVTGPARRRGSGRR